MTGGNGGGIFNQGTLTLNNSTVQGNKAGDPTNGGGTGAGYKPLRSSGQKKKRTISQALVTARDGW